MLWRFVNLHTLLDTQTSIVIINQLITKSVKKTACHTGGTYLSPLDTREKLSTWTSSLMGKLFSIFIKSTQDLAPYILLPR